MNVPFQHTGLVTTRAQLAKTPDISRRVVKSLVEGIHLSMANAEVAKQAFRRHIRPQQDRELKAARRDFAKRKFDFIVSLS